MPTPALVKVAPAVTEQLAPANAAPQAPATGMPKLQSFELPLAELAEVAQNSGLNWVNSNPDKIAAVQATIAAEPKSIRVARERPTVVPLAASPLVLVETKRDLRNMTLPFEETTPQ
jgi:ribonuclease E